MSKIDKPELNKEYVIRWNGEVCKGRIVNIVVGKADKETYWYANLEGQIREVVEVTYNNEVFYLDNENNEGWNKVTFGLGSPRFRHKSIFNIERVID